MDTPRFSLTAGTAFRVVLVGGLLLVTAVNMPGHLSYDSLAQLHEGRLHVRETWGPAVFAALLGAFDSLVPGTALYLAASAAVLFASLWGLALLRDRTSWLAPLVLALVLMSPLMLIYQGVVWKDVLFANLALAAFVLLAHAARRWDGPRRPWLLLAAFVATMALAAQIRPNGLIAAGCAALVVAWIARRDGWPTVLGFSIGTLAAILLVYEVLGWAALPRGVADRGPSIGVRIVQHYDFIGVAARDPSLRFDDIRDYNPATEALIRTHGAAVYSPERVDYIDLDPQVGFAFWRLPSKVVDRQWRRIMQEHTGVYLAHRLDVFRWVFMTPKIDSCLPLYVGVSGTPKLLTELRLSGGVDTADLSLRNYGTWFLDSPVFSHVTYAVLALLVCGLLLVRRDPQDFAIIGLMISAIGFSAGFLLIGIACDYRYLYFLDLAAMAGVIYLAVDPDLRRSRA